MCNVSHERAADRRAIWRHVFDAGQKRREGMSVSEEKRTRCARSEDVRLWARNGHHRVGFAATHNTAAVQDRQRVSAPFCAAHSMLVPY